MKSEEFRPKYHFTTQRNWINDPNGLIWHKGLYHLYYQHNPLGTAWGHMSWGHATSPDLIKWTEHDVAIPEDESNGEMIFSGSAVYDEEGAAGIPEAIVACYTSHYGQVQPVRQAQSLAISTDGGFTFTKQGEVLDRNLSDFRDPKVFRYQNQWRMVVVHSLECQVEILGSSNLRDWKSLSYFSIPEAAGVIWECPDLFELKIEGEYHWVLIVSVNPGGPQNGSGTKYFVGSFDGDNFTSSQAAKWLDYGRDNYAGVTFNNAPGDERILIGWMNSWGKTPHLDLTWTGAMTIPRRLSLTAFDSQLLLRQDPVLEPQETIALSESNDFTAQLNSELTAHFNSTTGLLTIGDYEAVLSPAERLELEILRDSCSIEVFAADRTISFTFLTFAR